VSIVKVLRERTKPMTVAEVAKLFWVTAGTVQKWARQKQIPCIRIGDTIRFDPTMLADWIELQATCTLPARAPGSRDDDQLRWQELGELAPEDCQTRVIRQKKGSG